MRASVFDDSGECKGMQKMREALAVKNGFWNSRCLDQFYALATGQEDAFYQKSSKRF